MDMPTKQFVLDIINGARDLTLATVRPDGYPQATTVSYANDGLTIYVGVGKDSQKAHNVRNNDKVSLTINCDYDNWNQIKGLSMGAVAEVLSDPDAIRTAANCLMARFPQAAEWAQAGKADDIAFLRIVPQVISVLDYQKGFGHTELVTP
jgi:general stress protein 26